MKANREAKQKAAAFENDERGVSVMVGALLLVGIFVATMVTIRVTYVPVWEEEHEANVARTVGSQLETVKTNLDRSVTNATTAPVSTQVSLSQRSGSAFRLPTLPNSLEFVESDSLFRVSSDKMRIHVMNGTDYTRLNETFTSIPLAGVTESDINRIRTLRLKVDTIDDGANNGAITLTLKEGSTDAGTFVVSVDDTTGGYYINHTTTDRWGTVLYHESNSFFDNEPQTPYFVDVMADHVRFDELSRSATRPFALHLVHSVAPSDAQYAMTYVKKSATGSTVVTDGGLLSEPFTESKTGGTVTYTAQNRYFVETGWRLEHGGLIRTQTTGAVFDEDPEHSAGLVDDVISLTLIVPEPVGDGASIAATGTATVSVTTDTSYRLAAEATDVTIRASTEHPSLWGTYWRDMLTDAGLSEAAGEFTITEGADYAELFVEGIAADTTTYDVYIDYRQADVKLEITG